MAAYTTTANQSAGISKTDKYWNEHGTVEHQVSFNSKKMALVSFTLAPEFAQKAIGDVVYVHFFCTSTQSMTYHVCPCFRAFNEGTVNWNNAGIDEDIRLSTITVPAGSCVLASAPIKISNFDPWVWKRAFEFGVEISAAQYHTQYAAVYGEASANKPYLSFNAEPVATEIDRGNPQGNEFLDTQKVNRFGLLMSQQVWDYMYSRCVVIPDAKSATIRWRTVGASAYNYKEFPTFPLDFPANTFPAKSNLEWQVRTLNTDNVQSGYSPSFCFTTTDSLSTCQPISPRSVFLSGNEPNTFVWRHVIATGTLQSFAELQASPDGQNWQPLYTVNGGVQQCTIPAGTLTGSMRFWRVRTKNRDGVAGQWSEAVPILVQAAPAPPALSTPIGTPRLSLSWQSQEQQAFELMAGDWKSGAVHGTVKTYTLPRWFNDGEVIVGVRVQSSLGLWSNWATARVVVVNQQQEAVQLEARAVPHGVKLTWTGEHDAFTVYRDGKPMLSTTQNSCTDWLAAGKHQYQVRGINARFYAMSNTVTEFSQSAAAVISDVDNIQWLELRYRRGSSPTTSGERSRPVTLRYLNGRDKPVAEVAEHLSCEHNLEYSVSTEAELRRLEALVGHTVVCKTPGERVIIGKLLAVSNTADWSGIDLSLTITETDYREVGSYDS